MADTVGLADLCGKTVIVTGGSTGIGEGCVRAFAGAGANVVYCARDKERGMALLDELSSVGKGMCSFWMCDVSKPDEFRALIDHTAEKYGRLDCLINNAGYHPPHKPIDDFSVEDFSSLLNTNLVSMFAGCKYALPYLRKTKGTIINMGSLVGLMGQEWATIYCATKGGISGFTKALAIDEARYGVRVNVVLPGNIITDNRKKFVNQSADPKGLDEFIDSWQWMGRSGGIDEVGNLCLFLASEMSSYITGCEFIISGGAELGYGRKCPPMFPNNIL